MHICSREAYLGKREPEEAPLRDSLQAASHERPVHAKRDHYPKSKATMEKIYMPVIRVADEEGNNCHIAAKRNSRTIMVQATSECLQCVAAEVHPPKTKLPKNVPPRTDIKYPTFMVMTANMLGGS